MEVVTNEILAKYHNYSIKNGKAHSAILYTKCGRCALLLSQSVWLHKVESESWSDNAVLSQLVWLHKIEMSPISSPGRKPVRHSSRNHIRLKRWHRSTVLSGTLSQSAWLHKIESLPAVKCCGICDAGNAAIQLKMSQPVRLRGKEPLPIMVGALFQSGGKDV